MTFVIHAFVTFLDEMRPDPVMVRESASLRAGGSGQEALRMKAFQRCSPYPTRTLWIGARTSHVYGILPFDEKNPSFQPADPRRFDFRLHPDSDANEPSAADGNCIAACCNIWT